MGADPHGGDAHEHLHLRRFAALIRDPDAGDMAIADVQDLPVIALHVEDAFRVIVQADCDRGTRGQLQIGQRNFPRE